MYVVSIYNHSRNLINHHISIFFCEILWPVECEEKAQKDLVILGTEANKATVAPKRKAVKTTMQMRSTTWKYIGVMRSDKKHRSELNWWNVNSYSFMKLLKQRKFSGYQFSYNKRKLQKNHGIFENFVIALKV